MNKIVLLEISSKYVHESLSMSYLEGILEKEDYIVRRVRWTINQNLDEVVYIQDIIDANFIMLSSYIWNHEETKKIVRMIRKINPAVIIIAGGPQAQAQVDEYLEVGIDLIYHGEVDRSFLKILKSNVNYREIPYISYKLDGKTVRATTSVVANLNDVEYPFDVIDPKRILYYESQRGCPYNCTYCLSANDRGVRFRDLERVKADLKVFLEKRVKIIKFVDRSFNSSVKRAINIIEFLIEEDNGITTSHFELSPNFLTKELVEVLKKSRKNQFQVEIGIQSTDDYVNQLADRPFKKDKYWPSLEFFTKELKDHVHLHLDLIAGLPGSNRKNIIKSFNELYLLRPNDLQLGFLKVIPSTPLSFQVGQYGITFRDHPPYEVLSTSELSFSEIVELKMIEKTMKIYDPSNFSYTLGYLLSEDAYGLFYKIANFIGEKLLFSKFSIEERMKYLDDCFDDPVLREYLFLDYFSKRRNFKALFGEQRKLDIHPEDDVSVKDTIKFQTHLDEDFNYDPEQYSVAYTFLNENKIMIRRSVYEKNSRI